MNRNLNYVSLDVIANKILKNPILKDMNYEDIIDHALSVIKIAQVPGVYREESCFRQVENHKALIPKHSINIKSVGFCVGKNVLPMVSSTDNYNNFREELGFQANGRISRRESSGEYKINNSVVQTSFKTGTIFIVFDTIRVDDDGIPMVPDSEALLRAIEAYIKTQAYTVMADLGKISERALDRAEKEYYFNIGKAQAEFQGFINEDHAQSFINGNKRTFITPDSHSERFGGENESRINKIL